MAVAAVSTGSKVSMFFCCPFDALGGTMATYAGQNVGAKKLDRVKEGLKAASLIGIIYSLIAFVVLLFGGKYIALLFMDADQTEIIGRVAMFLIGNSMFYIPLTFVNVVRFTIQGMGFSTFAILAGVCEMAARSLVGFCLVPVFGFLPACFASPLAWIFADAFLLPAFFHCMKKLKVLFAGNNQINYQKMASQFAADPAIFPNPPYAFRIKSASGVSSGIVAADSTVVIIKPSVA